ncbi:hypothetical protein [Vibrio sp. Hep-1b-8]|uniref:hypothetical protein n=1 Tax=Vibrio sp. Hep-1b-8 TaxID=2144187 RepID=UPI001110A284|nr:hypothetical protein [Vibrio sp. Hep-1b-8]TMX33591.1 hypothetical protein DA100_16800 [Vibrio sp. Hep-1b-8]TMX41316.1 hypothetical protein DA100_08070 [Vibrio sp. Hep-1b-8]
MKNNQSIESLKEQLYNADVAYSWEHKGLGGKYEHLWRWGVAFFVNYSIFVFFWFILEDFTVDTPMFWVAFVLMTMTMMMLMTRYLYLPDKHRCYHLTAQGIRYTEQDMIPEVAYKIVRGFAWVGIAVCVIAVLLLGPLALVGAGAFALMSFGMTNFQPTVDKSYVLIDDRSVVFNLTHDSVLSFGSPNRETLDYTQST